MFSGERNVLLYGFSSLVSISVLSFFIADSSSAVVTPAPPSLLPTEVKVASTPVAAALPSLLPNEDDYRGTTTTTTQSPKKISATAQNIIDSFPLLDFMQSTVLTKL